MSFRFQQKIHSAYTGATLSLRPAGAMYIVQDALTGMHAEKKCGNMEMKRDHNCFWVVTKTKLIFRRYPAWHETVEVTADTAVTGRIRCESQVLITDAEGKLCVQARQELCVLDFERHRPQRLSEVGFIPEVESLPPMEFERFPAEELPEHHAQTVLPHMIDMSGHLNNVEYVKIAMDCFDSAFTALREPAELEVHHLRECKEGALLSVCEKTERDISLVRILCDGAPAFEMKILWRNK